MISEKVQMISDDINQHWLPPKQFDLCEWAENNLSISSDSADAGLFRALPFQREILDMMTNARVETVVVRKSARIGYTTMCTFLVGYHIAQQPAPIMFVQPTITDAQSFSKNEFINCVQDNDILRHIFNDTAKNTIREKSFPGGRLMFVGANSPSGFRRVSIRILILDEINGYPLSAGDEGCPIKLAIKRTESFHNRKIVMGSTPTNTSNSKITQHFNLSDQRFFEVPCPDCGEFQAFEWTQFLWIPGEPETVKYECIACKCLIDHHQKFDMIENGKWVARNPESVIKGYHIWSAYSYLKNASWSHIVKEWESSKGNTLLEKVFSNTWLGVDYDDEISVVTDFEKWRTENAEDYPIDIMPEDCLTIVAGADVQLDKIVCVVIAFNKNHIYVIAYREIYGDTMDESAQGPWAELEELRVKNWAYGDRDIRKIKYLAVDSGGAAGTTHIVYEWSRKRHNVLAVKGASHQTRDILTRPTAQKYELKKNNSKKTMKLYIIGVHKLKLVLFNILTEENKTPESYYIHVSSELPMTFFRELFSEKLVSEIKKDGSINHYFKKIRQNNEVLDCMVYALYCYMYNNKG